MLDGELTPVLSLWQYRLLLHLLYLQAEDIFGSCKADLELHDPHLGLVDVCGHKCVKQLQQDDVVLRLQLGLQSAMFLYNNADNLLSLSYMLRRQAISSCSLVTGVSNLATSSMTVVMLSVSSSKYLVSSSSHLR